jgi:hypothetical protein
MQRSAWREFAETVTALMDPGRHARHRLEHRGPIRPGPGGAGLIEEYLAAVAVGLVGPRRWRSEVIAELRDELAEAAEGHRRSTGSPRRR